MSRRRAQRVELARGRVRIRDEGPEDGSPVLLIHGLSYPLEVWEPVVAGLVEVGRRVIRYDLYGRGEGGYDGGALGHDVLVDQAESVLDVVGIGGLVGVVSLSNGDLIAAGLAARAPARVSGLGFIAPSGLDPRMMRGWPRWRNQMLARCPTTHEWLRRKLIQRMRGHGAVASEAAQGLYAVAIERVEQNPMMPRAVLNHLAHLPSDERVRADLEAAVQAGVPMAMLCFDAERDASQEGVAVFPAQIQRTVTAGGHMGMLDDAAPVVAWLLGVLR